MVESYLYAYACPKVGHARNRSRTACFNEGFLKQAILSSKQLAGKRVDKEDGRRYCPTSTRIAVLPAITNLQ